MRPFWDICVAICVGLMFKPFFYQGPLVVDFVWALLFAGLAYYCITRIEVGAARGSSEASVTSDSHNTTTIYNTTNHFYGQQELQNSDLVALRKEDLAELLNALRASQAPERNETGPAIGHGGKAHQGASADTPQLSISDLLDLLRAEALSREPDISRAGPIGQADRADLSQGQQAQALASPTRFPRQLERRRHDGRG